MSETNTAKSNERRTRGDAALLTSLASRAFEILPTLTQRKKHNATLRALEPVRERIIAEYNAGIQAGTIAKAFTVADEEGRTVSTETIRAAILEIVGKPKARKAPRKASRAHRAGDRADRHDHDERKGGATPERVCEQSRTNTPPRPTQAQRVIPPPMPPSTAPATAQKHAGFEEDPR